MFTRHRIHPDPTSAADFRDRLDALAAMPRVYPLPPDPRRVRGRLAVSASGGLRRRLARPSVGSRFA